MFKFFNRAKKSKDKGHGHHGDDHWKQAFLHVSDYGWESAVVDPDRLDEPMLRGGNDSTMLEHSSFEHIGAAFDGVFTLAGEDLKGREGQNINELHILLDDPQIIYNDMNQDLFASAGAAVLLDIGRQQLHCRAVTLGIAPFGRPGQVERAHGVISFIDVSRLGNYLTRLNKLAIKVKSVTPLADMLIRRAALQNEPYAGISVGSLCSHLVIANPQCGSVIYRCLQFGTASIIRLLAKGSAISMAEAAAVLVESDMLSDLTLVMPTDEVEIMMMSPADRLLGDAVRKFLEEITNSFNFFETQRGAGRPVELEIFGEVGVIRGLDRLFNRLGESVRLADVTLFDTFRSLPADQRMNLLSDAGAQMKIGNSFFSFYRQGLLPAEQVQKEITTIEDGRRQVAEKRKAARTAEKEAKKSRGPGKHGRASSPSLIAQISALVAKIRRKKGESDDEVYQGTPDSKSDLLGFAGVAGLCVVIAFVIYDKYTDLTIQVAGQGSSFYSTELQVNTLRSEVEKTMVRSTANADSDKVLWTEKILALSRAMTNEMWLTDLYLKNDTKTSERSTFTSKRLVLEGAVLPSTDGHLLQIGDYIQRLEADTANFMSDFREVIFQGMSLDMSESDQVVRFVIEAVYDEAKGREIRVNKPAQPTADISQTRKLIDKRNQSMDKYVPGQR